MPAEPTRRGRGRPAGGGVSAEELKTAFLDAAERLFIDRGYRTSTIEDIAREAGYSRGSIYRHFPTRDALVDALVQRTTQRHMTRILERLPADAGLVGIITEAMVIVSTELIRDPLLKTIADSTDENTIAHMLAHNDALLRLVEEAMAATVDAAGPGVFRAGLRPRDLARYLVGANIAMLLGLVPGAEDPDIARRYIEVFVLPAITANPGPARAVFPDED
ncbi:helix-turn-helix domain-containing protein [Mycobacterium sp. AMU20-3851]|uniref:TetR/AcrR family transcriptional regulator n=1 Tax=Mycobacterium sp. AMU20-3851 TaxID=3122055 RepID=UPI003753EBE1